MGISLNKSNVFTITDSYGNTKFSLSNRMPHIFGNFSGSVVVPKIYETEDFTTAIINRVDTVVILSENYISSEYENSFILPFYKISGGASDTGGKIISGVGSTVIRKIYQPTTRDFLGSSILDIVQEDSKLKMVCNQHIDKTGFNNIDGDSVVTIDYRIYYGRFK
jgi:hypothetical protein